MKYIVVTGGSVSGIGKGTAASAVGVVLRSNGHQVTAIKIDPYLNVDAGTISPHEHGEVFVLRDGHESDLDLGNYERALEISLTRDHNITTGKIYRHIIAAERNGDFLGATVQVVPHITDCIQDWILRVAQVSVTGNGASPNVCLLEVGGTVGDIESSVYLEALQQFFGKLDPIDYCLMHVTFVPEIGEEQKTKPAQHSFRFLREAGLRPDFLFVRSVSPLNLSCRAKLSMFSQVPKQHVIGLHNAPVAYGIPQEMVSQNLGELVAKRLGLTNNAAAGTYPGTTVTPLDMWNLAAFRISQAQREVRIGIVGKYMGFNDTYLSIIRALEHATCEVNLKLVLNWVDAENLVAHDSDAFYSTLQSRRASEKEQWHIMKNCHGILAPGGFGERGIEGKIAAARYCRENQIPYFGICLGLQTCLIEGARNLLHLTEANSEEFDSMANDKIVIYMPETLNQKMGGTMRLGDRVTYLCDKTSLVYQLYDHQESILERHRHRYEVNVEYVTSLEEVGYHFVGKDEKGIRMEVVERRDHPFFLATQYHPEFTSTLRRPNPLFLGFVLASAGCLEKRLQRFKGMLRSGESYVLDNLSS